MSVINDDNRIEITGDGDTDVLELGQTRHKVYVFYVGAAAGTLTFRGGEKESELIAFGTPNAAGALEATTTGSKIFEMPGGGVFGVSATGVSGQIKVTVTELLP